MLCEMLFSVAVPFLGTALSALVISLLGNEVRVLTLILCVLSASLGYGLVNAAQTFITTKHATHNIEMRLELFMTRFVKKGLNMPLESAESAKVRNLAEKAMMGLNNNSEGLEGFARCVTRLGISLTGLLAYSVITGLMHPLILLMMLGFSMLSALIARLPHRYYNRVKDELAAGEMTISYIDRVVDNVKGGKDIRIFGLKKWIVGKYDEAIRNARRRLVKRDLLRFLSDATESSLNAAQSLVCYFYLIYLLQQGMEVAQFVFFLGIVSGFSAWLQKISEDTVKIRQCSVEISDLRMYLDYDEEAQEKYLLPENEFSEVEIVFDHVSYQYDGAEAPILSDISFVMKAGEHKALVGLNGAGKSTLVKLISGLYLPTSGAVYVNGIDTRELDRKKFYDHQAAVFQEAFTISYTIGENVAFAEKWEEERIRECLKEAGLAQKIESLPAGLNTFLGKDVSEDGISLSGGETQKLLLARALYRNPSLILLDEPTAALDAIAESEIYETYGKTLHGKTALFISHRLASTRFCDDIILLSEGRIAEEGTHEELMAEQAKYFELFQVQSKYYEEHPVEEAIVEV